MKVTLHNERTAFATTVETTAECKQAVLDLVNNCRFLGPGDSITVTDDEHPTIIETHAALRALVAEAIEEHDQGRVGPRMWQRLRQAVA